MVPLSLSFSLDAHHPRTATLPCCGRAQVQRTMDEEELAFQKSLAKNYSEEMAELDDNERCATLFHSVPPCVWACHSLAFELSPHSRIGCRLTAMCAPVPSLLALLSLRMACAASG